MSFIFGIITGGVVVALVMILYPIWRKRNDGEYVIISNRHTRTPGKNLFLIDIQRVSDKKIVPGVPVCHRDFLLMGTISKVLCKEGEFYRQKFPSAESNFFEWVLIEKDDPPLLP